MSLNVKSGGKRVWLDLGGVNFHIVRGVVNINAGEFFVCISVSQSSLSEE